jgi:hypothetical protein
MDTLLLTKCLRCRGAVIYDKFYGPHDQFWGWKCLICGEIVDPVILENRELMRARQGISLSKERMRVSKGIPERVSRQSQR